MDWETRRLPTLDQVRTALKLAPTAPSAARAKPSSSPRRSGGSGPQHARLPVRGRRRRGQGLTTRSARAPVHRRSRCGHGTRISLGARPRPDQVRTATCTPSSLDGAWRREVLLGACVWLLVRATTFVIRSFRQRQLSPAPPHKQAGGAAYLAVLRSAQCRSSSLDKNKTIRFPAAVTFSPLLQLRIARSFPHPRSGTGAPSHVLSFVLISLSSVSCILLALRCTSREVRHSCEQRSCPAARFRQ
jgi:hypothetical protein